MKSIRHIVREVIQEELKLKSPIGQGKDHIVYNYEGDPSKVVKVAWGSKDGNKYSPNAELEQIDLDSSHIDTFISNPDLVERFAQNATLAEWDQDTFYVPGAKGFTDYPKLEESVNA